MLLSRFWTAWRKRVFRAAVFGDGRPRRAPWLRTVVPAVELLEGRVLLSVVLNFKEFHDPSRVPAGLKASPLGILPQDNGFPFPVGYLPGDLSTAYGIDR